MELPLTNFDGKKSGSVKLSDAIFGLEPRQDLIQRCIVWQLAKRRAGTHKVKGRAEIWRTSKKMYKQKGTGGARNPPPGTHKVKGRAEIWRTGKKMYKQNGPAGARHGSQGANLFRGGGRSFGPVVRSHEIGLPKKVRVLALKHALSAKAKDGGIVLIDKATVDGGKTKALKASFAKLGLLNALIIDGAEVDAGLRLAARNLPNIDVLPIQGINVYDILRRTKLVLPKAAVDALEARFK